MGCGTRRRDPMKANKMVDEIFVGEQMIATARYWALVRDFGYDAIFVFTCSVALDLECLNFCLGLIKKIRVEFSVTE